MLRVNYGIERPGIHLTKEMKDLILEITKHWWKKLNNIKIKGKISHVCRLEKYFLNVDVAPTKPTDSMQILSKFQQSFSEIVKMILKFIWNVCNFWFFIQENSTCCRATKPHEPQLLKPGSPKARALQPDKPPKWEAWAPQLESSPRSPKLEKACAQHRRPSTAKNK